MMTAAQGRPTPFSLFYLVWIFGFVGFAGTTLFASHPVARAVAVLLYGVPVASWVLLRYRAPVDRLDAAVIIAVVAHLLVSVSSLDRESSLEMSGAVVAYASTFWLARRIAVDPRLRRVSAVGVATALCFWLVVIAVTWIGEKVTAVRMFGWPPILDAHQPYVWGSINTPPVLALLAGPLIAWLPPGIGRRGLTIFWIASAIVVVPLSVGRAGWLGIAVAMFSVEPLLGFPVTRRLAAGLRRRLGVAWATAGILVAALCGGVLLVAVARGGEVLASALDSRIRLWQQAMSLFAADPLTGAGPSTFGWARLEHVADYVDRVAAKDVHSVPMQTLSDGGMVLALGMSLVVVAWASLVIERRSLLSLQQRLSIAALVGYGAVGLLDDLSFLPAVTVMVILLAAWSIPVAGPSSSRATGRGLVIPAAVLLAAVVAAPAVVAMTGSRLQAAEGRRAAVAGDWDLARFAFERAARQQPSNAQHWMSVGLAAAMGGTTDEAIRAYERARSISPGDPRPWGALAALETDEAAEIRLLEEATRRSNDARYAYRLGDTLLQAGQTETSIRSYAIAAAVEPDWFGSLPMELWLDIHQALPDAVATVGSIGGHRPQEAWWNAGLALGALPEDAGAAWHAVERAMAGDAAGADEALGRARREEPNVLRIDQAAAAVAWIGCDRDAYDRAQERIGLRDVTDPEFGHPVRERPAGVYREPELGDYQPLIGVTVRGAQPWPLGFIEVPDCGW